MTTHESNAAPSRRAARRGDEPASGVVTRLQELAPHLEVEPDPAFRAATRQRLVAMAAVRTPEPVRPSALRRMLAARAVAPGGPALAGTGTGSVPCPGSAVAGSRHTLTIIGRWSELTDGRTCISRIRNSSVRNR